MNKAIADIRKDYMLQALLEADVDDNPFSQFSRWWDEAVTSAITEVNAMTLATATKDGAPSARIVLLKGFSENGFIFFSNYESHKGKELNENPQAALVFFWKELERQIRIEGDVERITSEESDLYYNSRPVGSRIGAWASPQSQPVTSREVLENSFTKFSGKFKDDLIERPPHWGGYNLKPNKLEFWQGRASRLHDRIEYVLQRDNRWKFHRLAP
ncbi:MAG TPA: pyridoxamine 5'-phosphate oxidase [Segetibacter sp.]